MMGDPTFTRSQLRDHAFFLKHRAAIERAQRDGRIVDDTRKPATREVWKAVGVPQLPAQASPVVRRIVRPRLFL